MAPFILIFTVIVAALIWFALKKFKCSRRTRFISITIASLAITCWVTINDTQSNTPESCFERHFGSPAPSSVTVKSQHGGTALAGSSEYLFFSISPDDLSVLIEREEFVPVEIYGSNAGKSGDDALIDSSNLTRDINSATKNGLIPDTGVIESKFDGMVYRLLLIDASGTNVMLHYYKT